MRKRIFYIVLVLLLTAGMSLCVHAHEAPDPNHLGTITVTMSDGGELVPGGRLALYKVGDVAQNDGNFFFILTDQFAGCGQSLDDISATTLPNALAEYVIFLELSPCQDVEINENGVALFGDVEPGLYLVLQTVPAEGYNSVNPFLVSLPVYEDGSYRYDIDASPKMSDLIPVETTEPTPTEPKPPQLPQTGQLNWPVPVLATAGLFLFLVGFMLCSGKRKEKYEE